MKAVFPNGRDNWMSIEPNYETEEVTFMIEDGKYLSEFKLERRELFHFIGALIKIQKDLKEDSKMNTDS